VTVLITEQSIPPARSPLPPVSRNAGIDALRAVVTLLVVFHHSALTYGAIGGWFYREVPTDGRLETKLLILFCTVNQAWFMGLFFLLAGYFTPGPAEQKGGWRYLWERLTRLGLPLLIFGVVIGPITIALAQTAKGRPFAATLWYLWKRGTFDSGPLWFALALLIFCVFYLIWRAVPFQRRAESVFPSNGVLLLAALGTGAGAFALRLIWPVGVTVFNLQLGYFASYGVLFAAGCAGAAGHWLTAVPERVRRPWLTVAWLTLPIFPAAILLAPIVPALRGDTSGGWNPQAMVYAFWEPFVAWGFILGLLHTFEQRFQTMGPIWASLARRAYTIFIIHPPILVVIALLWRDVSAPHLVKFAVTGTLACLVCFWIAGLLLRVPSIRKVI